MIIIMLSIDDLKFQNIEKDGLTYLRISIYKYFYHDILKNDFTNDVGEFEITEEKTGNIKFNVNDEDSSMKKLDRHVRSIKTKLTNSINGNDSYYFDDDLRLPLVGLNCIGILDKGSEMIEIKPLTGCNANCSFCSVDEGPSSKKKIDYIVDKDFLVNSLNDVLNIKKTKMSVWINPHGEPLLYNKIAELVDDILKLNYVKDIHIVTNGLLLNPDLVDEFVRIQNERNKEIIISISISGLGTEKCEKSKFNKDGKSISKLMMGDNYNIDLVIKNTTYASQNMDIVITPVVIHKINDSEMEDIVLFAKHLQTKTKFNVKVGIQKFCKNKKGRNIGKEIEWDTFFKWLKDLEIKTDFELTSELGKLEKTEELPVPCHKGEIIKVRIIADGRYKIDKIGLYENPVGNRTVVILNCKATHGFTKAQVIASKHNIIVCKQGK